MTRIEQALVSSPDNSAVFPHKVISRRRVLFLLFTAFIFAVGGAGYVERFELRQIIKGFLEKYFPDLYGKAAELEELGLKLIGMPVNVELYEYDNRERPVQVPLQQDVVRVKNFQEAVDFFQKYPKVQTEKKSFQSLNGKIKFETFYLSNLLAENTHIRAVLGIGVVTPAAESLPERALAMRVILSSSIQPIIAPAVPVSPFALPNEVTSRYKSGDYEALNLPRFLVSQTILSLGHLGSDRQVVPNAERMVIQGKDIQGSEFQKRQIAEGTVYLWSNRARWGLAKWPDPVLQGENTSCARMFWELNPKNPNTGNRVFTPFDQFFFAEQSAQQKGFLNHLVTGAQYQQIGPTAIFRTDTNSQESDLIFIAPFLSFVAPHLFKEVLMATPVGNNSHISAGDDLILAISDAKYNTMYGFHPGILVQANGYGQVAFDTSKNSGDTSKTDFSQMNNSIALYLGFEEFEKR